jgi:hypothetical protein
MDFSNINLGQWGSVALGAVVVIVVALIVWTLLKKVVGSCVSVTVGCLILVVGLVVVGGFLLFWTGITSMDDLLRLFGI